MSRRWAVLACVGGVVHVLASSNEAALCGNNTYYANSTCTPCPPGHTRTAGDQDTTACNVCDHGYSVEDTTCVACCKGYTRRAGDIITRGPTECDRCAVNHHAAWAAKDEFAPFSTDLVCRKCEDGGWRDAGDDVSALRRPTECLEKFDSLDYLPGIVSGALFVVLLIATLCYKHLKELLFCPCSSAHMVSQRYELRRTKLIAAAAMTGKLKNLQHERLLDSGGDKDKGSDENGAGPRGPEGPDAGETPATTGEQHAKINTKKKRKGKVHRRSATSGHAAHRHSHGHSRRHSHGHSQRHSHGHGKGHGHGHGNRRRSSHGHHHHSKRQHGHPHHHRMQRINSSLAADLEAQQNLKKEVQAAAGKVVKMWLLLVVLGFLGIYALYHFPLIYLYEQSVVPDGDSSPAATTAARTARWCGKATDRNATLAILGHSANGTANATQEGVATGTVAASFVAITELAQAGGSGAVAVVNGLAPAVPEIGFDVALQGTQPGGPNVASGLGSMQTMHAITGVCDGALLEDAVTRQERRRRRRLLLGGGSDDHDDEVKRDDAIDQAHQELRASRQSLAWTNLRFGIWKMNETRLFELARSDLIHWIDRQEKNEAEQDDHEQEERRRRARRLRGDQEEGDDEGWPPHNRTADPFAVHRILRRRLAAADSADAGRKDASFASVRAEDDPDPVLGANPTKFILQKLMEEHRTFEATFFWLSTIVTVLVCVHLPTVAWARQQVSWAKRDFRLKKRHRKKAQHRAHRHQKRGKAYTYTLALFTVLSGKVPCTEEEYKHDLRRAQEGDHFSAGLVGYYAETWPRIEIVLGVMMYQCLSQSATFVVLSPARSMATRAFAAFFFAIVLVGAIVWSANFVRVKVLRQRRAALVRSPARTGGFLRWEDMPPGDLSKLQEQRGGHHRFSSGFVSQFGPLFEDMKARGAAPFAIPVLMTSRLLVGALTASAHMPDKAATAHQCYALLAVFALLCAWVCCVRPFLIRAANACEAVIAALQFATVLLNLTFVGDDESGTFLGLTRAKALDAQKGLIMAIVVFMVVRFVALMAPVWAQVPRLFSRVYHELHETHTIRKLEKKVHDLHLKGFVSAHNLLLPTKTGQGKRKKKKGKHRRPKHDRPRKHKHKHKHKHAEGTRGVRAFREAFAAKQSDAAELNFEDFIRVCGGDGADGSKVAELFAALQPREDTVRAIHAMYLFQHDENVIKIARGISALKPFTDTSVVADANTEDEGAEGAEGPAGPTAKDAELIDAEEALQRMRDNRVARHKKVIEKQVRDIVAPGRERMIKAENKDVESLEAIKARMHEHAKNAEDLEGKRFAAEVAEAKREAVEEATNISRRDRDHIFSTLDWGNTEDVPKEDKDGGDDLPPDAPGKLVHVQRERSSSVATVFEIPPKNSAPPSDVDEENAMEIDEPESPQPEAPAIRSTTDHPAHHLTEHADKKKKKKKKKGKMHRRSSHGHGHRRHSHSHHHSRRRSGKISRHNTQQNMMPGKDDASAKPEEEQEVDKHHRSHRHSRHSHSSHSHRRKHSRTHKRHHAALNYCHRFEEKFPETEEEKSTFKKTKRKQIADDLTAHSDHTFTERNVEITNVQRGSVIVSWKIVNPPKSLSPSEINRIVDMILPNQVKVSSENDKAARPPKKECRQTLSGPKMIARLTKLRVSARMTGKLALSRKKKEATKKPRVEHEERKYISGPKIVARLAKLRAASRMTGKSARAHKRAQQKAATAASPTPTVDAEEATVEAPAEETITTGETIAARAPVAEEDPEFRPEARQQDAKVEGSAEAYKEDVKRKRESDRRRAREAKDAKEAEQRAMEEAANQKKAELELTEEEQDALAAEEAEKLLREQIMGAEVVDDDKRSEFMVMMGMKC